MKNLIFLFLPFIFFPDIRAQSNNNLTLAKRIVNESLMIKKGEIVCIFYASHSTELANNIEAECKAANARPISFANTEAEPREEGDKVFRHGFLTRTNLFDSLLKAQIWIIISPLIENPQAKYSQIPDKEIVRLAAEEKAIYEEALNRHVRILHVFNPSKELAESLQIDYETYQQKIYKANTYIDDQNWVVQNINRLKSILEGFHVIRITTESGTNFSFKVNNRPIIIQNGKISKEERFSPKQFDKEEALPGWTLNVSILEYSTYGKVVIPRALCDFSVMTNVSFDFNNGKIQNFKAQSGGECFTDKLAQRQGRKNLMGSITFSFNPELQLRKNDNFILRPNEGAGSIWITIGGNSHLGGNTPETYGQFSFPIVGSTVTVDKKIILKHVER